jgi:hypothetical protein
VKHDLQFGVAGAVRTKNSVAPRRALSLAVRGNLTYVYMSRRWVLRHRPHGVAKRCLRYGFRLLRYSVYDALRRASASSRSSGSTGTPSNFTSFGSRCNIIRRYSFSVGELVWIGLLMNSTSVSSGH